jgi:hypothetical protein
MFDSVTYEEASFHALDVGRGVATLDGHVTGKQT